MNHKKFTLLSVLIICGYLVSHLWNLTELPIFSDEAIYIRWAQLIIDDPGRYLFFALNDGKTPLFIWFLTPFQFLFSDQQFAGRIFSVLVGLIQLLVVRNIIKKLDGSQYLQLFGMLMFAILPFWFFHHRIALMDGLLVLFISLAVSWVITITQSLKNNDNIKIKKIFVAAIFLAAALFTKIPAILAFPSVFIFIAGGLYKNNYKFILKVAILLFGLTLILMLPILLVPAMPQLFSRGSDFLMPLTDFFASGYKHTIRNFPNYLLYFSHYLSPFVLVILTAGLFKNSRQKLVHQFFWAGIVFLIPIALLGLVVYSRYLLPAGWFFTMAFIFAVEGLILRFKSLYESRSKNKRIIGILTISILGLMIANTITISIQFMIQSVTDADSMPLAKSDQEQYLEKWSSGHGIAETAELIKKTVKTKKLSVATEGYFGTLPDGLLVYFHRQNTENISIDGIGQPVRSIPDTLKEKSTNFDESWLVVNSDRLIMEIPKNLLIKEFCRPNNAPCLQVWNITTLVK